MALNQNQFTQATVQGQMDLKFQPSIISCQIDTTSAGGLLAGQAVKIVDSVGGIPKVVECDVNTNDIFGFLTYDMRRATFEVGDKVEIAALRGNVMYMTASAAIARNAKVAIVIASKKVVTATTVLTVAGRALDKAAADGDLIRVVIDLPGVAAAVSGFAQAAHQADTVAADLAALKVDFNALLAKLQAAALMA